MNSRFGAAAAAVRNGDIVVYPTETVYGLGANALSPAAIDRVYSAKQRSRDDPLSFAVPDVETALTYVSPSDSVRRFMEAFLPGPVTVVCEVVPQIPRELTAGRDRVGVRVPDHEVALGLLHEVSPITATSANVSGRGSVTRIDQLDREIRDAAAVVIDGGETPGTESTVVDPERQRIHRRGAVASAVEEWLTAQ